MENRDSDSPPDIIQLRQKILENPEIMRAVSSSESLRSELNELIRQINEPVVKRERYPPGRHGHFSADADLSREGKLIQEATRHSSQLKDLIMTLISQVIVDDKED